MEKYEEKNIITQIAVNVNLLSFFEFNLKANPNISINEFFTNWQKSISWDKNENYLIVNQGVILTHLYGLIMYPKEIFHSDIPNKLIKEIKKEEWGSFEVLNLPIHLNKNDKKNMELETITEEGQMTIEFFIRKIRNSIGHGRVEILEDSSYIFNDEDETRIKFKLDGLKKFIQKFREGYINQIWL